MAKTAKVSDSEGSDDLPELVDCTDDEVMVFYHKNFLVSLCSVFLTRDFDLVEPKDSSDEEYPKKPPTKAKGKWKEKAAPKAKNNGKSSLYLLLRSHICSFYIVDDTKCVLRSRTFCFFIQLLNYNTVFN